MSDLPHQVLDQIKNQNQRLNELEQRLKIAHLESLPPMIQIEPTNRCDAQCKSCARTVYDSAQNIPGDFPEHLFDFLTPALVFARTVLFGGYGEPLLSTTFVPLLKLAKRHGCRTEIISNGRLIDADIAALFTELKMDRVILSVDGATDKKMNALRGISLTEILSRVELLQKTGGASQIVFNTTLREENLEDLSALVSIAADNRVAAINCAHQMIYHSDQEKGSLFHHIDKARSVFDSALKLAEEKKVELSLPPLEGVTTCHQPFDFLMVTHTGRIQGCCSAAFGEGKPRLDLGQIPEVPLLSVWNHPTMIQTRAAYYGNAKWPEPCDECGYRLQTARAHTRILDGSES